MFIRSKEEDDYDWEGVDIEQLLRVSVLWVFNAFDFAEDSRFRSSVLTSAVFRISARLVRILQGLFFFIAYPYVLEPLVLPKYHLVQRRRTFRPEGLNRHPGRRGAHIELPGIERQTQADSGSTEDPAVLEALPMHLREMHA